MPLVLRPKRGGFLRPFGCGWFVREFLLGNGSNGSPAIDPDVGAPQADIFYRYRTALIKATAEDRATRQEEKQARHEKRAISPDNIEELTERYLARSPYKANGCRYHSFVIYFSNLQRLGWVEPSGHEEPSAFQEHYPSGPPRRYYRLTAAGMAASEYAWANPYLGSTAEHDWHVARRGICRWLGVAGVLSAEAPEAGIGRRTEPCEFTT